MSFVVAILINPSPHMDGFCVPWSSTAWQFLMARECSKYYIATVSFAKKLQLKGIQELLDKEQHRKQQKLFPKWYNILQRTGDEVGKRNHPVIQENCAMNVNPETSQQIPDNFFGLHHCCSCCSRDRNCWEINISVFFWKIATEQSLSSNCKTQSRISVRPVKCADLSFLSHGLVIGAQWFAILVPDYTCLLRSESCPICWEIEIVSWPSFCRCLYSQLQLETQNGTDSTYW